jgi:hypothetical protein
MRPDSCYVLPDGVAPESVDRAHEAPLIECRAANVHPIRCCAEIPASNWILYDNALEQFGSIWEGFDRD